MKGVPRGEVVDSVKRRYPAGARVRLNYMNDLHAPPEGTLGTVIDVDDIATVHVQWDNGSCLGVVFAEDSVSVVKAEG